MPVTRLSFTEGKEHSFLWTSYMSSCFYTSGGSWPVLLPWQDAILCPTCHLPATLTTCRPLILPVCFPSVRSWTKWLLAQNNKSEGEGWWGKAVQVLWKVACAVPPTPWSAAQNGCQPLAHLRSHLEGKTWETQADKAFAQKHTWSWPIALNFIGAKNMLEFEQ